MQGVLCSSLVYDSIFYINILIDYIHILPIFYYKLVSDMTITFSTLLQTVHWISIFRFAGVCEGYTGLREGSRRSRENGRELIIIRGGYVKYGCLASKSMNKMYDRVYSWINTNNFIVVSTGV